LLYWLYRVFGTLFFFLSFPFVSLYILIKPQSRYGIAGRIGNIPVEYRKKKGKSPTLWVHASSVGEVQAAYVLITELVSKNKNCNVVLSTMTMHGLNVARKQLPPNVFCFPAPLDVPFIVRRVLTKVKPSLYICLETELWPAMLTELKKSGTTMALLNGRMTERSFNRYSRVHGFMQQVLSGFSKVSVIREEDGNRFRNLGVPAERIQVTGNIKYDFPEEDLESTRKHYRSILGIQKEKVFICGSTRSGEENILAGVFQKLQDIPGEDFVWVIAPRHLERLGEVHDLLSRYGMQYNLYTELTNNKREQRVVLVDCMGELTRLYSAGDFIFCGGSLVEKRGHNIMEAARWGRPVYYGPSMDDYRDAVEILENDGAGFQVAGGTELVEQIVSHLNDDTSYKRACANAARVVSMQRGAAIRQADIVRSLLLH